MGQIKFSGLVVGIKGKIGGTVFQSGRTGYAAKNNTGSGRGYIRGDGGVARMKQRNYLSSLSNRWGSLSVEYRDAWNNEAQNYIFYNRFGDPYTPSGYQLFMSLNLNLNKIGLPTIDAPKPKAEIEPVSNFRFENFSVNDISVKWDSPTSGTFFIIVYGSPQRRPGKSNSGISYKYISSFSPSISQPYDLTNDMLNAYSFLQAGSEIWFKIDIINIFTGQRSSSFYIRNILTS